MRSCSGGRTVLVPAFFRSRRGRHWNRVEHKGSNMPPLRIVYVHGIHGHPPEPQYQTEWDTALKRQALLTDVETRMVYWADIHTGLTDDMVRVAKKRARQRGTHTIARIQAKATSRIGGI